LDGAAADDSSSVRLILKTSETFVCYWQNRPLTDSKRATRSKLRRIAEKLAECALNGEPWAISQVADRIDGKAAAEIQTEQSHRYVIEVPAELTREQWIQKYSPSPPIGTSTPSDESLVLSNE
jgi:hypothetical protein